MNMDNISKITVGILERNQKFLFELNSYLLGQMAEVIAFDKFEDLLKINRSVDCNFYIVDIGIELGICTDVISDLRSSNPSGILVLSDHVWPDAFVSVLSAGADMVLNKPIRCDQVAHALQTIARRNSSRGNAAKAYPLG